MRLMIEPQRTARVPLLSLALFVLPALLALAACAPDRPAADAIVTNAKVYTVDAARPWAEAVAVKDGRLLAVGTAKSCPASRTATSISSAAR